MAQADGNVANGSGSAVRQDINNQLSAVFSNHSGTNAPTTTVPYQFWADTTTAQLKMRNAADSDWIVLRGLDGSLSLGDGTVSNPGIAFSSDPNQDTGFYRPSNDTIGVSCGGVSRFIVGGALSTSDGGPSLLWKTAINPIGSTSESAEGLQITQRGKLNIGQFGGVCVVLNRNSDDGKFITFKQATNEEGSISVSGNTVSLNGAHLARYSQLPSNGARTEILRGTVLTNLDEMCEWGSEGNEQLNRMQVSNVEGDVNVSGVFQDWDDDDETYTKDFYCAMTGDFVIRIAEGTTVARGDLLMSAGDGTAKPQDDDIVRSKTIAKVTSTVKSVTYSDKSYCVPCVLMAC